MGRELRKLNVLSPLEEVLWEHWLSINRSLNRSVFVYLSSLDEPINLCRYQELLKEAWRDFCLMN